MSEPFEIPYSNGDLVYYLEGEGVCFASRKKFDETGEFKEVNLEELKSDLLNLKQIIDNYDKSEFKLEFKLKSTDGLVSLKREYLLTTMSHNFESFSKPSLDNTIEFLKYFFEHLGGDYAEIDPYFKLKKPAKVKKKSDEISDLIKNLKDNMYSD